MLPPTRDHLMSRTDDRFLTQLQARYRLASRKERTAILDGFVKTTGYHRRHAIALLNRDENEGKVPFGDPDATSSAPALVPATDEDPLHRRGRRRRTKYFRYTPQGKEKKSQTIAPANR